MFMLSKLFKNRSILIFIISCLFLVGIIIFIDELDDTVDVNQRKSIDRITLVSVVEVLNQSNQLIIKAYSEVRPKWKLELKADVSGKIESIMPEAQVGARVKKGQLLFNIEKTQLLSDLAEAKHGLNQSLLELKRSQYESHVAKQQFNNAGKIPPNDFSILLPQVKTAQSSVEAAKARVILAQKRLSLASVKAPFSGILTSKSIHLGQNLIAGEAIATLITDNRFELTVSLNKSQWQKLEHPLTGKVTELLNEQGNQVGTAIVKQAGGYLDTNTRQYLVQLSTTKEKANIVVGDYLQVVFKGLKVNHTLRIPATALTQDGAIWWVDRRSLLQKNYVDLLARYDQFVVVSAPNPIQHKWNVLTTPLSSYLPGQKVSFKENKRNMPILGQTGG